MNNQDIKIANKVLRKLHLNLSEKVLRKLDNKEKISDCEAKKIAEMNNSLSTISMELYFITSDRIDLCTTL